MTRSLLLPGALALGWLALAGPALAFQAEVARYYEAVASVCQTGITPALQIAYEDARQAVERAQYGAGRANNFWGLRTPEAFWLDCFQAPDGKT
jgi:hypothetical protein